MKNIGIKKMQRQVCCALTLAAASSAVSATADQPMNVLFILADDFGWMDTGVYGSKFYETPNIDRLAARGILFTDAYAANPLCSPTRASILTGLYPARLGLTAPNCHIGEPTFVCTFPKQAAPDRKAITPQTVNRLDQKYYTLAEAFHDAGYRTAHFGKWHLGSEPYSPFQHGYEEDIPHWWGPGPAGSYVAPWKFPSALHFTGQPGENIEDRMGDEAIRYIRKHRDEPWYVAYWAFSVHWPMDSNADLIEKYKKKLITMPDSPQRNPVYAAMVEVLDRNVGRLIDTLDQAGLSEKTIIIFTSDNGGVHFSDKTTGMPSTCNTPLRGGKATIYEGGQRVPLIVVWPGKTKPGSRSNALVSSVDYYPTLMEMTGTQPKEQVDYDGVSFVPALTGGASSRTEVFCHYPHQTPLSGGMPTSSIRQGDWKLIRCYCDNDDQTDRFELYNLHDDLGETKNLAEQMPEKAATLNKVLQHYLDETGAVIPPPNPNYGGKPVGENSFIGTVQN